MKHPKFKIFCDFDGTVAIRDVGNELFRQFATPAWEEAVEAWKRGDITSKECLERECAVTTVTREQLKAFCAQNPIDPTFAAFADFCRQRGYPLEILSDGMDFYIQEILKREGLDWVPVKSNHLIFVDTRYIRPEFPYWEHTCGVCANCKGYHLRAARDGKSVLVYVGDGLSDRCGVLEADVVFAKDELIDFCRENGLNFVPYRNFEEVLQKLKNLEKEKIEPRAIKISAP
jgi:2,3-diketo-5-methylthio-1-phosphopentane phosphatase